MSVFGDDGDFKLSDDAFFEIDLDIRGIPKSINGYLNVDINFNLKSSNGIVTTGFDKQDLSIIPVSKSGDFDFHSDSEFGDSVSKDSCSIIFGVSNFNDGFVLNLQFKAGDVFNSPSLHFCLD